MWFGLKVTRPAGVVCLCVFSVCLILLSSHSAQAQQKIRVTISDTTGNAGVDNSVVTVFLQNQVPVSAFELWLQLSRPDILSFQTDVDTVIDTTDWLCIDSIGTVCSDSVACNPGALPGYVCIEAIGDSCIDSLFRTTCQMSYVDTVEALIGNIDTAGTRISGWELVLTRSITGTPYDIKVTGKADQLAAPTHPPMPVGSGVLFRLLGDIAPISDTVEDREVRIIPQPFLDHFNFSDTNGISIGIIQVPVPDTNYWRCMDWVPPDSIVCLDMERVPRPPYDSISIETVMVARLDTTQVKLREGKLRVNLYPGACCVEDTISGETNCIIASGVDGCELLAGGTYKGDNTICEESTCLTCCVGPFRGNVDNDPLDGVSLGDLTALIDVLFISLNAPACWDEANIDGSPDGENSVSLGDLTALIDILFISLNDPPPCP